MEKVLLSLHVVGAIVLIGPVTIAVALFPRYARGALAPPDPALPGSADRCAAVATVLHRISRTYAVLGLAVPVVGMALAGHMHVLGDAWLVVSLALTAAAAVILAAVVLPDQHRFLAALAAPPCGPSVLVTGLRAAAPGAFAVLWVVVVVLMVARPGSTTGV